MLQDAEELEEQDKILKGKIDSENLMEHPIESTKNAVVDREKLSENFVFLKRNGESDFQEEL